MESRDKVIKSVAKRPSWDEIFMQVADVVSQRSTCLRRKVGAVLVKDRHIIATGFNGAPAGMEHCIDKGVCLREELGVPSGERLDYCYAVHSEANLIIQSAIHGRDTRGSEVYLTCSPCTMCAKLLVNAGIKRICYKDNYPDKLAMEILRSGGVLVENYSPGKDGGR